MKTWRTFIRTGIFLIAAAFLLAYASGRAAAAGKTYPNARLLVETEWLVEHLDDPSVRLVDVRSAEGYTAGHIKNAVNIPIRPDLSATIDGVRGMVAPPGVVEESLSKAGIDKETHVIAYDASGGLWAARLFWILEYYGHQNVSLLNGGITKWAAESREITRDVPVFKEARFTASPKPEKLATMKWIKENMDNEGVKLLDARSHKEYVGEDVRSERGGHIPGAVNLNWVKTVSETDKTFLPYRELRNLIFLTGARKNNDVVTYCQTGVRGAQLYYVLRLLGYENVRLYDGSWEEWGNVDSASIERKVDSEHKTC